MKPQQILNDPEKAISERWPDATGCPCRPEIEGIISEARKIKTQIKVLKSKKSDLSKDFRDPLLAGSELDEKKQRTKHVTRELKANESALREKLQALGALFSSEPQQLALPERFEASRPVRSDASAHKVVLADESIAEQWDSYVRQHPQASLYHRFRWKHTFEQSHRLSGYYIAAMSDKKQIVGVLPCFLLDSRLFGRFLVSVPYVNYGGPLADNEKVEIALLDFAQSLALDLSVDHLEIRSLRELNGWPQKTDKVSMVLPLPEEESTLLEQLGSKTRAQINQAKKHRVDCRFGKSELLDHFYQVFARNMRDLGTPVYAKSFFATILADFHEETTIVVTYNENKPVAAGFLLASGGTLEIPWASSLRKMNHLNVNMYM